MLIREYATTDVAAIRRGAASCAGTVESFVRDDGRGGLVVCDGAGDGDTGMASGKSVQVVFVGGRYGVPAGDWLFYVGLWTPHDYRNEFLAWYQFEHLPMLLECPLWDGCRFVEEAAREGCQFHALHQLSDRTALDSMERKRSRTTPWFIRLSANDWFDGAFTRTLCRRLPE